MAKNRQYIRQSGTNPITGGQTVPGTDEGTGDDTLVDIVEVKEHAQDFFEKNQTLIIGALAGLLLLIGGYLGYKYGYKMPREKAGMEAMYKAETQFKQDSFALALTNPGAGFEGFLDIIDNYSGTKASNLASYYAGISYLNLGNYDAAIEYLSDYSPNDDVTPITRNGAMGDAYAELNQFDKALSSYKKAVNSDNDFLTPYYINKVALLEMKNGNNDLASQYFERLKEEYPQSSEAKDAIKYLTMLKAS